MNLSDIVFEPHLDMSAEDGTIIQQHDNFIKQNNYDDAAALLNETNYKKGFRASLFNSIQNRLRNLEIYLLNQFAAKKDEYYSLEEPALSFMDENGYQFWIKPY